MAPSPFVSEEVLHAFVDGETDAQTNAVILAYLSASPADAARVEAWRRQNAFIRASFNKVEHEPIPLSLSLAPARTLRTDTLSELIPSSAASDVTAFTETPRSTNAVNLTKLCAAIGIAFAGGMIAALVTPQITRPIADLFPGPIREIQNAADMTLPSQTLEVAALRESDPTAAKIKGNAQAQTARGDISVTQELTHELAALDLSVTGLWIGTPPKEPALCLFLSNKAAQPLTLCRDSAAEKEAHTPETEGVRFLLTQASSTDVLSHSLRAVNWQDKTGRFALAGRLPNNAMLDLSQRIQAQIEAAGTKR